MCHKRILVDSQCVVGMSRTKLAASSVPPLPVYLAIFGYGNSGRVRIIAAEHRSSQKRDIKRALELIKQLED